MCIEHSCTAYFASLRSFCPVPYSRRFIEYAVFVSVVVVFFRSLAPSNITPIHQKSICQIAYTHARVQWATLPLLDFHFYHTYHRVVYIYSEFLCLILISSEFIIINENVLYAVWQRKVKARGAVVIAFAILVHSLQRQRQLHLCVCV